MRDRIVYVEWADHWSDSSGWDSPEEGDSTHILIKSVGLFVKESKEVLTIALSKDANGLVSQQMNILKNCIKKKKVINV